MIIRRTPCVVSLRRCSLCGACATPALSQSAILPIPRRCASRRRRSYKAKFDTTKGVFVLEVNRDWAPNGADRFYNLVKNGFYDNVRFFRVISGFMVQFGINGDPKLSAPWREARIQDDPVDAEQQARLHHLRDGRAEHAHHAGVHQLRRQRAASTARASRRSAGSSPGMDVVDKLNADYGEGAPRGRGPDQGRVQTEGNAYLQKDFRSSTTSRRRPSRIVTAMLRILAT